jgi:hypothetical protein
MKGHAILQHCHPGQSFSVSAGKGWNWSLARPWPILERLRTRGDTAMDDIAFLKRLHELREMAVSPDALPQQALLQLLDAMIDYLQHRVTVEDSSILEDRTA